MKALNVFLFSIIFSSFILACSNNLATRKSSMSEINGNKKDLNHLRRWFVLSDSKDDAVNEVSFVLSSSKLKAYILMKRELFVSLGLKRGMKNQHYSCSKTSDYCSICINLKHLALDCNEVQEGYVDSEGVIIKDNQMVLFKNVIFPEKRLRATKIIFSGFPAKFIYNTASLSKYRSVADRSESYKFTNNKSSDDTHPEILCRRNLEEVTCNAVIKLARL